jgi:hypothetical protein
MVHGEPLLAAAGKRGRYCLGCGAVRGLTSRAEWSVHPSCARCDSPVPSGRAGREGWWPSVRGGSSAERDPRGCAEAGGAGPAFVAWALGESHPAADVAVLLASELVTNSVRHSGSAVPGGVVTVTVAVGGGGVRVEVTDRSGDGAPVL